ncbi:MAG: response regulator transcription factor [Bacilli bacterium]
MSYLIYSVEDDTNISNIIRLTLQMKGYEVSTFNDGKSFFDALEKKIPDLVLLDIMLPDMSGLDILKILKSSSKYNDVRIIILSAKSMIVDKVEGLDLGADDYIAKPFDILELVSRVNAQKRRQAKDNVITVGDLVIDQKKRECKFQNTVVNLTKKEFDILLYLIEKPNEVVSRDELIQVIWGNDFQYETRTIDMHIKSLRKKLPVAGEFIKTIYGVGYMLSL